MKKTKKIITVCILSVLIIGAAAYAIKVESTIEKVSKVYGEQKPQIMQIKIDQEETTHKIMYLIFIKGNFKKDAEKSQNLEFSMTGDCNKVWALRFDSWVDNDINISN